ncbi:MbtH family protein [Nocardia yamanashiensis]|uniref:MbtH family protein n=1 Tax=Nocardia yamanashiensis TaxID=209247 RepID=UPI00082F424C|nr:MbtH family protein [Nocardia yamanashiensis]
MTGTNPFDNEDGLFKVLVNDEGQYSLWPDFAPVPDGWHVVHDGDKPSCVDYVEKHWLDMRPRSLIEEVDA